MKIHGIEGMTVGQLTEELRKGGRFVVFQYAVSLLVVSFRRPSGIYFIRAGESTAGKSTGFTLASLLTGWWGIPWGPIFTLGSVLTNLRGGKDVTHAVVTNLLGRGLEKTYGFPVVPPRPRAPQQAIAVEPAGGPSQTVPI